MHSGVALGVGSCLAEAAAGAAVAHAVCSPLAGAGIVLAELLMPCHILAVVAVALLAALAAVEEHVVASAVAALGSVVHAALECLVWLSGVPVAGAWCCALQACSLAVSGYCLG